jgi:hypothetical protein
MRPNIAMQLTTTNQFDHHDQLTTIKPTTTITITHCDGLYDWLNSKFKVLLHVARWYGIMVWYGMVGMIGSFKFCYTSQCFQNYWNRPKISRIYRNRPIVCRLGHRSPIMCCERGFVARRTLSHVPNRFVNVWRRGLLLRGWFGCTSQRDVLAFGAVSKRLA